MCETLPSIGGATAKYVRARESAPDWIRKDSRPLTLDHEEKLAWVRDKRLLRQLLHGIFTAHLAVKVAPRDADHVQVQTGSCAVDCDQVGNAPSRDASGGGKLPTSVLERSIVQQQRSRRFCASLRTEQMSSEYRIECALIPPLALQQIAVGEHVLHVVSRIRLVRREPHNAGDIEWTRCVNVHARDVTALVNSARLKTQSRRSLQLHALRVWERNVRTNTLPTDGDRGSDRRHHACSRDRMARPEGSVTFLKGSSTRESAVQLGDRVLER